jgi:hypothetical protein
MKVNFLKKATSRKIETPLHHKYKTKLDFVQHFFETAEKPFEKEILECSPLGEPLESVLSSRGFRSS